MKEKLKNLTDYFWVYDYWKEKIKQLDKQNKDIIISDFDDCLFWRKSQLEQSELLRNNRWNNGTKVIFNEMWIQKYIDNYIKSEKPLDDISSLMNPETDIILTAGVFENQYEKIAACGLNKFKTIVVDSGKDKIIATIRYIIFDLGFVPHSITIYEDRPEYFIEYRGLLEDILETKIIIKKVVMNGNNNYEKIEEV